MEVRTFRTDSACGKYALPEWPGGTLASLLDRRTPVAKNAPVAIRGVFLNATDKRELASGETVFSEGDPGMAPTCMP